MDYMRSIVLVLTSLAFMIVVSACVIQTAAPSADQPQMSAEEVAEIEAEAAKSGLTVEQALTLASLEDGGLAPELTNDVWLNSEPLRLADLRGKVVIVEFWTYG